jgi:hypothetical protein
VPMLLFWQSMSSGCCLPQLCGLVTQTLKPYPLRRPRPTNADDYMRISAVKKTLFSAFGMTMFLGVASAFAQGMQLGAPVATDLPWSINRQPPRNLDAYAPDSAKPQTDAATGSQQDNSASAGIVATDSAPTH